MQKIVLCTLAVLSVALAAPQQQQQQPDDGQVYIVHQDSNVHPEGYQFSYETSDGTSRQEQGTLQPVDEEHSALAVQGRYRYVAPDGLVYTVSYTADQGGFKPQQHLEQHQ